MILAALIPIISLTSQQWGKVFKPVTISLTPNVSMTFRPHDDDDLSDEIPITLRVSRKGHVTVRHFSPSVGFARLNRHYVARYGRSDRFFVIGSEDTDAAATICFCLMVDVARETVRLVFQNEDYYIENLPRLLQKGLF